MMMPPRNWLAAVLALRIRPQSNEPRNRLTRGLAGDRVDAHLAEHRAIAVHRPVLHLERLRARAASTLISSRWARPRIEA